MKRLIKGHTTKNAAIIEGNGECCLKSYDTIVIRVKDGRLVVSGTYSSTTRRHIGWFLRDKFGCRLCYQDIKKADNLGCAIELDSYNFVELSDEETSFIREQRETFSCPF